MRAFPSENEQLVNLKNASLWDYRFSKVSLSAKTETKGDPLHAQSSSEEIRFGPNTDEHDYNFKLKHAEIPFRWCQSESLCVLKKNNFSKRRRILLLRFTRILGSW